MIKLICEKITKELDGLIDNTKYNISLTNSEDCNIVFKFSLHKRNYKLWFDDVDVNIEMDHDNHYYKIFVKLEDLTEFINVINDAKFYFKQFKKRYSELINIIDNS